jgi:hypothetical protein
MSKVWDHSKQSGTALLLLLAIADFANDDGMAWPGVETLAKKIKMSERYVHRLIKDMAEAGELRVEYKAGKKGTNQYWVTIDPEPECTVNTSTADPEPQFPETLNYRPPEPSENHQEPEEQPTKNRSAPPKADYYPLAAALAEVCVMPFEPNKGRLFKEAGLLAKAQPVPTPDLLRLHYSGPACFWRKEDWRGKKGERPTPPAIRETWGQWKSFVDPMAPSPTPAL